MVHLRTMIRVHYIYRNKSLQDIKVSVVSESVSSGVRPRWLLIDRDFFSRSQTWFTIARNAQIFQDLCVSIQISKHRNLTNRPRLLGQNKPLCLCHTVRGCTRTVWTSQQPYQQPLNSTCDQGRQTSSLQKEKKKQKMQKVSRSVNKSSNDKKKQTNTWHTSVWRSIKTLGEATVTSRSSQTTKHHRPINFFFPFFYFCHDMNWMRFFVYLKRERRGCGWVGGLDFSRADRGLTFSFNANNLHQ